MKEMRRLVKAGGVLILGTPDYGRWIWPTIEYFYGNLVPGGYADEHITHYEAAELRKDLEESGFSVQGRKIICGGEVIFKAIRA